MTATSDLDLGAHVANALIPGGRDEADDLIRRCLRAIRTHLGLRIAYVSEFVGDHAIFRVVDAPGFEHLARPGYRLSLSDAYCMHILEGRLPELIPDTSRNAFAREIPMTSAIPIGAHVSVPIRLADQSIYGMFCCLGPSADPTLTTRDLQTVRAFAELVASEISKRASACRSHAERSARIDEALRPGAMKIMFQPIWGIAVDRPIGFEALARFPGSPRPPEEWFAEAAAIGRSTELELNAIDLALQHLHAIPTSSYLSVNCSPATTTQRRLRRCLVQSDLKRIVLEITEHSCFDDLGALGAALAPLRRRGLRIAVDDAGAGYTSLQEILRLQPDIIKLDRAIVRDVAVDPGCHALVRALVYFTGETGSSLVAEGVETIEELDALSSLGVDTVQGYYFGRPKYMI